MILLTGATGCLGRRVLSDMVSQNWIVRPLVRDEKKYREMHPRYPGPIVCDFRSLRRGDLMPERLSAVVHIASEVWPVDRPDPSEFFKTNVDGSHALLESLNLKILRHITLASTTAVYGSPRGPVSESLDARPDGPYAESKLRQEEIFKEFGRRHGVPVAILRYTSIYGPGQHPRTVLPQFLTAAQSNRSLIITGPPARLQNFIYVRDASRAACIAFDREASGIFNIAATQETTLATLASTILKVTGARAHTIERPDPKAAPPAFFHVEAGKAAAELDWRPRYDLEHGLRDMIAPDESFSNI